MPKEASADTIVARFDRRVRRAVNLTNEGLKLYGRGQISQGSLDGLFHYSFLSMHSDFEVFLENLFYSAVTGDSEINDCVPQVVFESRDQANIVLFSNKDYVDWMPFKKNARKISRLAFKSGSPFDRLERQTRENEVLEEFSAVRNAIAHQSAHAQRQIEKFTSAMRPRRRHAAGYLQSKSSGVSTFTDYATNIQVIAQALASPDFASAKQRLSPEEPYRTHEQPGTGVYECARCGITRTVRSSKASIGQCKICKKTRGDPQLGWRRRF